MNTILLSDFLNNSKYIIKNTIYNNELNLIKTDYGNVVLIAEHDFNSMLNLMHKSNNLFNRIE